MTALASSIRTVRKRTQQQRDVVLLTRVIYSEDNLQQTKNPYEACYQQ